MLVADIPKEPYLAFRYKHGHAERMNRCIPESLIVKSSTAIEPFEILLVRLPTEEIQISNLEVREELAVVVVAAIVGIEEPVEVGLGVDEFRVGVDEGAGTGPEGGEGARVVEDVHVEAVFEVVVTHEAEDVVGDVAEEVDLPQRHKQRVYGRCRWLTSGSTRQYQSKSFNLGCL